MLSLKKDSTEEFIEELLSNTRLLIMPKINGFAIAIKYIKGKFDRAINRRGVDVARTIEQVKNLLKEINIRSSFVVSGELSAEQKTSSYSQRIAAG